MDQVLILISTIQKFPALITNQEDTFVFLTRIISLLLLKRKKCSRHIHRETANENKQFQESKTLNLFILDKTKVSMVLLWIGHATLVVESPFDKSTVEIWTNNLTGWSNNGRFNISVWRKPLSLCKNAHWAYGKKIF